MASVQVERGTAAVLTCTMTEVNDVDALTVTWLKDAAGDDGIDEADIDAGRITPSTSSKRNCHRVRIRCSL